MPVILRTDAVMTTTFSPDPYLSSLWWLPGTPGGSTADATDCLDRFRDFWVAVAPKIATGVTIQMQGVCVCVNDSNGVLTGVFTGVAGAPVVSAGGSNPLPAQTQGMVHWLTNGVVAGRRVRGRTYVPLPDEADNVATATPGSSYTTQLAGGVTAILAAGATASQPVVWHRPVGGSGGSSHPITGGGPRQQWAVLRSRR